jgi:hypothetical protein
MFAPAGSSRTLRQDKRVLQDEAKRRMGTGIYPPENGRSRSAETDPEPTFALTAIVPSRKVLPAVT